MENEVKAVGCKLLNFWDNFTTLLAFFHFHSSVYSTNHLTRTSEALARWPSLGWDGANGTARSTDLRSTAGSQNWQFTHRESCSGRLDLSFLPARFENPAPLHLPSVLSDLINAVSVFIGDCPVLELTGWGEVFVTELPASPFSYRQGWKWF